MAQKRKKSIESLFHSEQSTKAADQSQSLPKRRKVCDYSTNAISSLALPGNVEVTSEQEFSVTGGHNSMYDFCNKSDETFYQLQANLDVDSNSSSVLPTDEKLKVLIVGAGISGLGAAVVLKKAGADVMILEAASQPGGRMKSVHFPNNGKLKPVSIDIGADILIDCSDASNDNLLYNLAQSLGMETMEVPGAFGWDSPLAMEMVNLHGKKIAPRIVAKMYYLHQAIICFGVMKIIRDAGFDIPDASFASRQQKQTTVSSHKTVTKTKERKKNRKHVSKLKERINPKATDQVLKRGSFDFNDGEIDDVMEDTFTKVSIRDVIDFGKQEYEIIRTLSLTAEEATVLECIFAQIYGNILPLDLQNGWDIAYNVFGPRVGLDDLLKQIEGPSEKQVTDLVKIIKNLLIDSKKTKPSFDDIIADAEDRLICESSIVLIDYLASKVDILYDKQCRFVHYKDHGVAVDCTEDDVWQSFDADYCVITVPPDCLREGAEGSGLQISPQMSRAKRAAIKRISMPVGEVQGRNKVVLRFDKIFWDPNLTSFVNPERRVSVLNYHKIGKENVLCIQIWASSDWNMIHSSDEDLCAKCCEMLKHMFPRTYKRGIKLVNWAVSRWNEDPLVRCSSTGLAIGATSNDFVLFRTPLPSVENPRVCFAGEATIDVLNGPIQTAHGAFLTGVREARRISIANNKGNLRCIPRGSGLMDFITAESDEEEESQVDEVKGKKGEGPNDPVKVAKVSDIRLEVEAHNIKQCAP